MSQAARRLLYAGLLALSVVVVVLLSGCGLQIEPGPTWNEMTEDEREAYCLSVQTRFEVADWARSDSSMYRYMLGIIERCKQGGYL